MAEARDPQKDSGSGWLNTSDRTSWYRSDTSPVCHVSDLTCWVSDVTCHVSDMTCRVTDVTYGVSGEVRCDDVTRLCRHIPFVDSHLSRQNPEELSDKSRTSDCSASILLCNCCIGVATNKVYSIKPPELGT